METFFVITFIGVVIVFLTRSKVGALILGLVIACLIIGVAVQSHQDSVEEAAHKGKVQIYHNGEFEWVTPEEQHSIYKQEADDHYRKWAAEHPEEAEKERIKDSVFRAHYGYGLRSIFDPQNHGDGSTDPLFKQ